jgi:hypothetical protein
MVKGKISSSTVGVREGVKVSVGTGEGVTVSKTALVDRAVGAEGRTAGWQAVSRNKKNRQAHCFMK